MQNHGNKYDMQWYFYVTKKFTTDFMFYMNGLDHFYSVELFS